MRPDPPQSFESHSRVDHAFIWQSIALFAALLLSLGGVYKPVLLPIAVTIMAFTTILLMFKIRGYPIVVQDRLIKLEMELRLERILPDDLKARVGELDLKQLIALRFGSDEELPDLVRRTLDGELATPTDIKKAVTNWQSDHQRV